MRPMVATASTSMSPNTANTPRQGNVTEGRSVPDVTYTNGRSAPSVADQATGGARRGTIGSDRAHHRRVWTLTERPRERVKVQLPVQVGPRRVVESFGLPQRSQVVDDLAASALG